MARDTTSNDDSDAIPLSVSDLLKQIGCHCHAQLIIIMLITKAACHAAALDRRGYNIKPCTPQDLHGLGSRIAAPLLAV